MLDHDGERRGGWSRSACAIGSPERDWTEPRCYGVAQSRSRGARAARAARRSERRPRSRRRPQRLRPWQPPLPPMRSACELGRGPGAAPRLDAPRSDAPRSEDPRRPAGPAPDPRPPARSTHPAPPRSSRPRSPRREAAPALRRPRRTRTGRGPRAGLASRGEGARRCWSCPAPHLRYVEFLRFPRLLQTFSAAARPLPSSDGVIIPTELVPVCLN
jgi:hypothetical protein